MTAAITSRVRLGVPTPMVSAISISSQPSAFMRCDDIDHRRDRHVALIRTTERARNAAAHAQAVLLSRPSRRARSASMLSAMLQLMFFCENASLAAPKITISSTFASSARFEAAQVRRQHRVDRARRDARCRPSRRRRRPFAAPISARRTRPIRRCCKPAADSRLTSSILIPVATNSFSFCSRHADRLRRFSPWWEAMCVSFAIRAWRSFSVAVCSSMFSNRVRHRLRR